MRKSFSTSVSPLPLLATDKAVLLFATDAAAAVVTVRGALEEVAMKAVVVWNAIDDSHTANVKNFGVSDFIVAKDFVAILSDASNRVLLK
jgi:hypothetical protein